MSGMYGSTINRKYVLSSTFSKYGVHEVYADVDFTISCENPDLVVLVKNLDGIVPLHQSVVSVFPNIKSCSITSNPRHPAMQGKKIVYREGVWYV